MADTDREHITDKVAHEPADEVSLDPKVRCQVCQKEIPRSEARIEEGSDYTLYFCGLPCYDNWEPR